MKSGQNPQGGNFTVKAPASQEDVDDEKAEADAGFIAGGIEEMGVNGGTCINPNSSMPTIAPPLPHSLQTLTISIYTSRRYYLSRRSSRPSSGTALTNMDGQGMCAWREAR